MNDVATPKITLIDEGDQTNRPVITRPKIVAPQHPKPTAENRVPLGQRLIDAGLIRAEELESALSHQAEDERNALGRHHKASPKRPAKRLGEVITELGLVSENDLLPMLGQQLGRGRCKTSRRPDRSSSSSIDSSRICRTLQGFAIDARPR